MLCTFVILAGDIKRALALGRGQGREGGGERGGGGYYDNNYASDKAFRRNVDSPYSV